MRDLEQNTVQRGGSKNKRDEGVRARERDTSKADLRQLPVIGGIVFFDQQRERERDEGLRARERDEGVRARERQRER